MNVTAMSADAFASGAQSSAQSSIGYAVARKGLEQVEQQGDAAVSLIKAAADVGRTARAQVSASPSPSETGSRFDVTG